MIVRFLVGLILIGGGGWLAWNAAQATGPWTQNFGVEMISGIVLVVAGIFCWGLGEILGDVVDEL